MLFSKEELKILEVDQNKEDNVVFLEKENNVTSVYNISDKCDLGQYITSFDKDIEVISNGAFSLHQLVKYIISLLPQPCNIYATTWATTETVVATLVNMKRNNMIDNCYFLFDHRVMRYRPNAYILFKENFNCKILSIHAKICVIESKDVSIRIVGSGNWTRNNKIEVYSISSDREICNHYKDYITNELRELH